MLHFSQLSLRQRHNRARGTSGGRKRDEKSEMRTMTHTEDDGFFPVEDIFFTIVEMR